MAVPPQLAQQSISAPPLSAAIAANPHAAAGLIFSASSKPSTSNTLSLNTPPSPSRRRAAADISISISAASTGAGAVIATAAASSVSPAARTAAACSRAHNIPAAAAFLLLAAAALPMADSAGRQSAAALPMADAAHNGNRHSAAAWNCLPAAAGAGQSSRVFIPTGLVSDAAANASVAGVLSAAAGQ
ncbi:uncharacterized protein LOC125206462 [Salvia hispanica]|uniref:uncharacterized protein LOC125206462 n=1 Tax=Salvia hispanica TaxID=49212 RepID=UPI00200922FD|nr:uncharacterized protein LOC125206462 [Salvia hispanica]